MLPPCQCISSTALSFCCLIPTDMNKNKTGSIKVGKNKLVVAVNRLQNYALILSDNSFVKMSVNPHYPQIIFSTEFLKLCVPSSAFSPAHIAFNSFFSCLIFIWLLAHKSA